MALDPKRFLEAQQQAYPQALTEIKAGRKKSHWMWFIFPQLAGLGFSSTSQYFALQSLEDARTYLNHPVLGGRLREITNEVLKSPINDAHALFGSPDDLKLRSSMTLFARADDVPHSLFQQVLGKFFAGAPDAKTIQLLNT